MSLAEAFGKIFEGNGTAHYTWKPGEYNFIDRGITDADIERHLRGEEPGVLSIPIMANGRCHFAAGDADRHAEEDEPIDYVAVAKRITELGLPLIITRSKSPKSAHVWLCFKDVDGFSAAIARQLIAHYMKLLGLSVSLEIFPKQEKLKQDEQTGEWQKGSGINLPYFSDTRVAFGRDGEELDLAGFIDLVRARQAFGQVLAQRDLAGTPEESESTNEKDRPLPIAAIRRIHEKYLETLRASNQLGHWNDAINDAAFFAGRAFAAKALEDSELEIKNAIRKAAKSTSGYNERQMEATLDSGWESGVSQPLQILDPEKAHADALVWSAWVFDENAVVPDRNVAYETFALLTREEFEPFIKMAAKRLGIRVPSLEGSVKQRRVKEVKNADVDFSTITMEDVKVLINDLLDDDPKEFQKKEAEHLIWTFLKTRAKVFCCNGQGQFLMNDGEGVPIDVSPDSQEFNRLLIGFGIHPGSPTRQRIGEFIETKCFHDGVKTETRLGFHFERTTFASYIAVSRGKLIKVTRMGLEEVANGYDNQLFVFPDTWVPLLTKPLNEINGVTGMDTPLSDFLAVKLAGGTISKRSLCVHALFVDGFLARHLFEGSSFEIRSMDEKQIRILVMSCLLFLMMPGVVSERPLIETLGPPGSGKTFLLKLLGHTVVGCNFSPRPLPKDIKELETQIINDYFIAYDNVSTIPADIKDRLAQAVTGIEVVRRVLFKDKKEMREKSKATISLSAIKPPLPELEHGNRAITINFERRSEGSFIAEEELFKSLESKRDNIILNLLHRMILVLDALHAQKDYVPKVNIRLASIATFILRIARHEKWEERANQLLDAWSKDQTGSSMQEDDISTAITRWIAGEDWKPDVELTSTMLNDRLCIAMGFGDKKDTANRDRLGWRGNNLSLANTITANLTVYEKRFGMKRGKSTLRTSRGAHTYRFNPTPEILADIRADAKYERDTLPQIEMPLTEAGG